MRQFLLIVSVFSLVMMCGLALAGVSTENHRALTRDFEFSYVTHVPALQQGSGQMRLWIPVPQTDAHQRISNIRISSPVPYRLTRASQESNRSAYFVFDAANVRAPFDITLTFNARRSEYRVNLPEELSHANPSSLPPAVAAYLQPNRLIPIDGLIADLSQQETEGVSDPLTKARKIYEYVIRTMHYDHDGSGWGRGDAIFACTAHHGNCTDFHSLFIGMARAAGIPARFEIGFPLPLDSHAGKIAGYHCWAEFYISGIGWVPIDASEAWQMPTKRNYFFGALDDNRIRFSAGRDLTLGPPQASDAVNYFVYPYAELDGKPFTSLSHDFSFRDLSSGPSRSTEH